MYENHKLCPDLVAKTKCFRVERYDAGKVIEIFHDHVPAHRLSLSSEMEALRALVGQCAGWNALFTLHSRLNNRGREPSRYPSFTVHVSHPEAGVIRRYVSAGNSVAWSDAVIAPERFRNSEGRAATEGAPEP